MDSKVCAKCGLGAEDETGSRVSFDSAKVICGSDSIAKCEEWLSEKCSISDSEASSDFAASDKSVTECSCDHVSSVSTDSDFPVQENEITKQVGQSIIKNRSNTYGNVMVGNSKHVIVGNVTYVTGPVNITQTSSTIQQNTVVNHLFLEDSSVTQKSRHLSIISRINWLAQPALSKTPLPEPLKYVIIAHTATEEGFTQAENTLLVRLVQTFHIESRKWDDIAYNFLVGSDGHVYEGRGWGLQGAHTYGYNKKSLGIGFVGCFMDHLPPISALNAAKTLILKGVELGHIPADYTLVGHCQCSPIESPGKTLYQEIKTWPRWRELTEEDRL